MISVYFESGYTSEEVAMFHDEETYMACLPSLEELARKQNWKRVTETIDDQEQERPSTHMQELLQERR